MDLLALIPIPDLEVAHRDGVGLAVSTSLGLVVTSETADSSLRVYALPRPGSPGRWVLRGSDSEFPMIVLFACEV